MRTRRTKDQIRKDNYNKDVDAYNFYVVNLDTKKAETGFEFKEDAVDVLNDYDDKKKYKVVSKRALKSMGIENPNESFKYEGGGDFQSGVYATGGGVQGKINQSKNIFQKQDLIRERYELLNDMYNNEDSNVDYTDIIKVGDVLYGDDINGYARIYREVNDPEKGDYFILQDRYNNKFAFLIIQTIRDLYAKELYIQNVNIPQKDFLYSDEVIDLNNQLEFHKGRINLYKKNPNDASNYSGINYSDYISSQSKVKELEDKLSLALKDEGHKFANGGSLIGNQKRIDLNKNGKIDAEDFKLLRTTMNGGWRKDHKYVNSSNPKEDYEVIYARKYKPSRKGYKGKTNFATGGGVDRFSEYSNDALYDMIINLSRYENTESDIQMVKAELEKRKADVKRMYLDYINNFITPEQFARHYKISEAQAHSIIRQGNKYALEDGYYANGGGVSNFKIGDEVTIIKPFPNADMTGKKGKIVELSGNNTGVIYILVEGKRIAVLSEYISKNKMATGGGISNKLTLYKSNYLSTSNKQVLTSKDGNDIYIYENEILYDSPDGKTKGASHRMSKLELNILPFTKLSNQKFATGGETKKGARGGIMTLAKQIRKDGEKWTDAVKRAGQQLK